MHPERWRLITDIFHVALERTSDERESYLVGACREDPSLRADVEAMLAGHDRAAIVGDPLTTRHPALAVGCILGPYRVEALLDAGGMGEVYRARDTRLTRDVAIKVLSAGGSTDPDRRVRFEREAHAAAALNHPNICAVFDVGLHEGAPFIVSELLEGQTLRQLCAVGPLPVRRALQYMVEIARGLAAAHVKGIVHRDLKPENVFVTTDARVKILDFGVARLMPGLAGGGHVATTRPLTEAGLVVGTVGYMSPEQVRGVPADSRSDIFSFGTVLFEIVEGRLPFRGETAADTWSAILHEDPPPLTRDGGVTSELERILRRCLEKSPENRFQSADDLAFALEAATLRPHSRARRAVVVPAVPARMFLFAAAIAMLVVAAGLGSAWYASATAVSPGDHRLTPFATGAGTPNDPAWSPNGLSIAYDMTVNGHSQVFARSLDSDSPEQITHTSADAARPFWWPDGSRVGFLSDGRVWSVNRAGGAAELVQKGWVTAAALSADGRMLAIWRADLKTNPRGLFTVWLASPPNAVPREYTPAPFKVTGWSTPTYLQFSPDGRRLLLADWTDEGPGAIWVLPIPDNDKHSEPYRLVPNIRRIGPELDLTQFSWMPDSQRAVMVFPTGLTPKGGLWMTDVRTGAATPLSAGTAQESSPGVSPSGRIAFTSGGDEYDLVEVPLDGAPMRDFVASTSDDYSGAWVPGSSRYVYLTNRNGDEELRIHSQTENWDRLIVDRHLADRAMGGSGGMSAPAASPDGQHVAFNVYGTGGGAASAIWIVPVGGGDPTRLTPPGASGRGASWSPDGQSIVCLQADQGGPGLALIRIGTGVPPQILAHDLGGTIPAWSPDGAWIAYQTNFDMHLVSPDGARHRVLSHVDLSLDKNSYGWETSMVWSRDSKTLYSIRRTVDRVAHIIAIDVATGAVRFVSALGTDFYFAAPNDGLRFTLAPDGRSFLATTVRNHTGLWILDGVAPRRGLLDWFLRR